MTGRAEASVRVASLLLGLACAGAMVGGAAEAYPVLAIVEASVFAAGIVALLSIVLGAAHARSRRDHVRAATCLGAFLVMALLQCVLPRPATIPIEGWKFAMGSLAPTETAREALKLAAFLTAFLVAGRAAADRRAQSALLTPIVAIAAVLALHGLLRLLFPLAIPPLYPHRAWGYAERLSATYTNPNHFAGMLEMALPLALAAAAIAARRGDPATPGLRSAIATAGRRPAWLVLIGVAVLFAAALTFTRSRLGILCGLLGAVAFVLLQRRALRGMLVLGSIALLVAACLLLLQEAPLAARFDDLGRDVALRLDVWRDTFRGITTHYGVTGSGLGTYLFTFAEQQTSYPHAEFAEAHNDFLQLVWETGVIGAVPAGLFLFFVLRGIVRGSAVVEGADRARLAGAGAAVIALVAHSVADFNLQVPANGLLFSICAGFATGGAARSADPGGSVDQR